MRRFDAGSIFEIEAERELIQALISFYEDLQSDSSSQVRFGGPPTTFEERLVLARYELELLDRREKEFYEEEWVGLVWRLEHGEATAPLPPPRPPVDKPSEDDAEQEEP